MQCSELKTTFLKQKQKNITILARDHWRNHWEIAKKRIFFWRDESHSITLKSFQIKFNLDQFPKLIECNLRLMGSFMEFFIYNSAK